MPDILSQMFGMQQPQDQGLVQNILSQRFQPQPEDAASAMGQTLLNGKVTNASDVMGQRMAVPIQTANMLGNLQEQGAKTQGLNLQNQMTEFQMPFMQDIYRQLYGGQPGGQDNAPPVGFNGSQQSPQPTQDNGQPPVGFQPNQVTKQPDPRIKKAELAAAMGNKPLSEALMAEYNADPAVIQEKERATKTGAQNVEDTVQARGTQDVIGLYNKLKMDATKAPSGIAENLWASATNAAGMPNEAAIAKGGYEADLNNLYLGMIRSLKGTGRVMQSELDELKNAQPKPADSTAVKQAKIDAHMRYYTNKMTQLGYDPATGKPLGNNQLAPHNLMDVNIAPSGGDDIKSMSDEDLIKALQ